MRLRARNRIVTGALLLLVLLVVAGALLSGAPPARAAEAFRLDARSQPLGMATDHARERYWLLERASGRLTLTAVGKDGAVQGQMTSRDTLTSGQALAYDDGVMFVGDVGGRRNRATIYQVTQPWPGTEILRAIPFPLAYPDGAHEAAAILVDANHRFHVVTAGPAPGIYRAPANPSTTEPNALERIADAPEGVTDAVVLLDGRWVLRTATTIHTMDPTSHAILGEAPIGVDERGQAIAQALDPRSVITAAGPEGLVTATDVPGPAPSTPLPAPTRTATPQAQAAEPAATRTFAQTGTMVAVGAALATAALAALVVLVRR